jgi:glycosyltransferase involved in cell wall biosynthesis
MNYDLSIIIPARNEEFLNRTVEDICQNKRGKTQVLVGLDGTWPHTPLNNHKDVVVLFYPESIGQRALSNQLVKLSRSKYIMKVDAHCAFDEGFDVKLMDKMEPDITMVPMMRNLHVFNWVCEDGHSRYQSPSGPCKECGKPTTKDIVWIPKRNPQSVAYRFDKTMHFQYWNGWGKKQKGDLTETMSIQGSCFMMTKEKYLELDICSEDFHSWGQQGVEVACKTWLSGGRVLVNRTTWYAHMFRTQGGDFSFPYDQPQDAVMANRELSRELFQRNKWEGAKYPFKWLIDKFNPPDWEPQQPTRGVLYYSDNGINMSLSRKVKKHIAKSGLCITSVTLKPTPFGNNFVINEGRGYLTMAKQILCGLENMKEDIVYFCEHDVLYHPNHFQFIPSNRNTFYYNGNYWFLRQKDGFAIHYDASPLSGLVVYREAALTHFRERVKMIQELGDNYRPRHIGFEPFTHNRVKWEFWCPFEIFMPEFPNIDVTHTNNTTWKRWEQKHFIRKPKFWEESTIDKIPGWPNLKDIL